MRSIGIPARQRLQCERVAHCPHVVCCRRPCSCVGSRNMSILTAPGAPAGRPNPRALRSNRRRGRKRGAAAESAPWVPAADFMARKALGTERLAPLGERRSECKALGSTKSCCPQPDNVGTRSWGPFSVEAGGRGLTKPHAYGQVLVQIRCCPKATRHEDAPCRHGYVVRSPRAHKTGTSARVPGIAQTRCWSLLVNSIHVAVSAGVCECPAPLSLSLYLSAMLVGTLRLPHPCRAAPRMAKTRVERHSLPMLRCRGHPNNRQIVGAQADRMRPIKYPMVKVEWTAVRVVMYSTGGNLELGRITGAI